METIGGGTLPAEGVTDLSRVMSLTALTALAIYLSWQMFAPFVSAFTWAFALAVACSPFHRWLASRIPRLLATLLIIAAVLIAISLPGALIARQLLQESIRAQQLLQRSIQSNDWQTAMAAHPWIGDLLGWADKQLDLSQIGQQLAGAIARSIAPALGHSVNVVSQAGVILLAFYFFLQDGKTALPALRGLLPLSADEIDRLLSRLSVTVRATVYGRFLIALIQGLLGGVIFALVGLPASVFWGAVMILLSLLPVFGAFLVWVPASLFLFAQGHWIKGLIVLIWGFAIIHPIDNLLYPTLVGGRIGLHPLVLFVAFVGGLIAFGPAGLILGPCIIAIALGIAEIWQARGTQATLDKGANT